LEEAFDKVEYASVIACLEEAGIDEGYIDAVAFAYADLSLYAGLEGGVRSRDVAVERGVRQGDPSCSLSFVMKRLRPQWVSKKHGPELKSDLGEESKYIHYLAFADDMTLFAQSKRAFKHMLADVIPELEAVGLRLNSDKCMVQCSEHTQYSQHQLTVDGKNFEVVSADVGFKVLGTTFALKNGTQK